MMEFELMTTVVERWGIPVGIMAWMIWRDTKKMDALTKAIDELKGAIKNGIS